tara:strand:- start:118 stop:612 length:495 start_codon:yes stop_codon:yes gene_type:complete
MKKPKISISTITYYKKEDIRILNACLSNWLSDPKILHFTSPNMIYPFNLKKWISLSYKEKNIETIIIKVDNWIVGHLSIKYEEDKNSAHLFHLIIDQNQLRKGYAKKLILYAEEILNNDKNIKKITLNVVKKNQVAKELYFSMGYEKINNKRTGNIKMVKNIYS